MLKIGIHLLTVSSMGVLYRIADLTYSALPSLKWCSLTGLCLSVICLMGGYLSTQGLRFRKFLVRQPDMIKSGAWKSPSLV